MKKITGTIIFCLLAYMYVQGQNVSGELKRWHKITIDFEGPNTSETANPNPFSDFRLDVTFKHEGTGKTFVVPGFYSGCSNPAENSCNSGNIWKVHFAPDRTGSWNWNASFKSGNNVAINGGGSNAGFMDGSKGSFNVSESDKTGRDHRSKNKGRTAYVGEHYLRYVGTGGDNANGDWFVKAGADAPENTLAYEDFDNTPNRGNRRKNWNPHKQDFIASDAGDYTWSGGKGSGLLGAVNYLSGKGVNAFSFLTLSLHGDDENVFPHLLKVPIDTYNNYGDQQQWSQGVHKDRFDVSKLAQWDRIFEYADKKGMFMHFKTMETENDNIMDGDNFGKERKLYYRELIARFGYHLSLNWNLTEETTLKDEVAIATTNYIKNVDPYNHLIVMHTYPGRQTKKYTPLLGNKSALTGASIQMGKSSVHDEVKEWVEKSNEAGKKWVVANDEQGNANVGVDIDPKDEKLVRHHVLWGTLTAGGAGVEYYYGYQTGETDLSAQNHRSRDKKYSQAAHALNFVNTYLQEDLAEMVSSDNITNDDGDYVFAKTNKSYVVYRPDGGSTNINLPNGNWQVHWYNPRNGGELSNATTISNSINAPDNNDWVALITKSSRGGEVDTTAPIINLKGNSTINLTVGDKYEEQSATATDNIDGDLSSSIVISGNVNTDIAGTYTVTYNVSDAAGNAADEVTRTIIVIAEGDCNSAYEEKNGLVVMEAENLSIAAGWLNATSVNGYTGDGYLDWQGADSFGTPGNGKIQTTIKISTPGTYLFQWRSKVGEGNNSTESNDSWLRFPDADDFFAQKGSSIVYPKGSGKTPNPNGAGADGWFKVYISGTTNWTWSTNTSDNEPHKIYVKFNSAGVYTMEISGRSKHHLVDRIVMSKDVDDSTSLELSETLCTGDNETISVTSVTVSPQTVSVKEGDATTLVAQVVPSNASNKNITWSSSNTNIASVDQNGKVVANKEGNAVITVKTEDGGFTKTADITVVSPEDTTAPIITLIGESTINLTVGDAYAEPGATATDSEDGNLTSDIAITGNVDTDTAGTYKVAYNVSDAAGNAADEVSRTIIVSEEEDTTTPIITLTGESTINLTVGDTYTEPGATATDNEDDDLTSDILITGNVDTDTAGTYTVAYNVSDAAGNAADEVSRTIIVSEEEDTTAPIITLLGESTMNLTIGETYTEPGATAIDSEDGDLTSDISMIGSVDTDAEGTYTVNYNVSDAAGNAADEVTRTIVVSNNCTVGASCDDNDAATENDVFDADCNCVGTIITETEQSPYQGTNALIPGKIEAENYDLGGQGVAYNDFSDGNIGKQYRTDNVDIRTIAAASKGANAASKGGYQVGWSVNGEWIEYTTNVTAGEYDIELRASSGSSNPGAVKVTLDGVSLGTINIGSTGSYDTFESYVISNVKLAGGSDKVLRLSYEGNDFDIDWIRFSEATNNEDTIAPIITLKGDSTINLNIGNTYVEQGATVWDNVDSYFDLEITGSVDTSTAGTYYIKYNVSDAAGNAADEVTRTVIVSTGNQTVSFSGISEQENLPVGSSILPIVNVSDTYGPITNVRLYINNQFIRQENAAPYEWGHKVGYDALLKNLGRGTYTLRAEVRGGGEVTVITLDFTVGGGVSPNGEANLFPIHDAFLENDRRRYNTDIVRVENNRRVAYLMFDVSQSNGNASNAVLQFKVASDAGYGNVNVYLGTSNDWTENNLNRSNKPGVGKLLGSLDSRYAIGSLQEIALPNLPAITGDKLSLILVATDGNDFAFSSKEGGTAHAPILKYKLPVQTSKYEALKVYPNPSSDRVTLEKVANENTELLVYDIYGKVVLQQIVSPTSKTIEISELSTGLYFIFLDGIQSAKFIRK